MTTDHNIQATIVEDSIAPSGTRLTTMLLTYPTMIHQDILTHRTMYKLDIEEDYPSYLEITSNKSTNSNRAKPTKQTVYEVWANPFCPTRFPKRAASMHSSQGYLDGWKDWLARRTWLTARYGALGASLLLQKVGVHKQIANRLLMPWLYTTLVVTAIDVWWEHFFKLRDHYMAQDEVQQVAALAHIAYTVNPPTYVLAEGAWHLPFVSKEERAKHQDALCIALSVARCARTSYARSHAEMMHVASIRPMEDELELFNRLDSQSPPHDGPKEHQARAEGNPWHVSGTLVGWTQFRHHYWNSGGKLASMLGYPPPHPVHA